MGVVVIVEGHYGVSDQVGFLGGEVLAYRVLSVVGIDEEQAYLGPAPLLGRCGGEVPDHRDAVLQPALADLALGVGTDVRIGEVQPSRAVSRSRPVSGQVVGVNGPYVREIGRAHV